MQVLALPSGGHLAHKRVAGARATASNAHIGATARPDLFNRPKRRVIGIDGIRKSSGLTSSAASVDSGAETFLVASGSLSLRLSAQLTRDLRRDSASQ